MILQLLYSNMIIMCRSYCYNIVIEETTVSPPLQYSNRSAMCCSYYYIVIGEMHVNLLLLF